MLRKLLTLFFTVIFVTGIGFILVQWLQRSSVALMPGAVLSSYDPAQYGLPPSIGAYKLLAVLTPDNTACMPIQSKRVIAQATQGNVSDYLKETNAGEIQDEIKRLKSNDPTRWEVMIVGPDANLGDLLSENQKWNDQAKQSGCVTSGPVPTQVE